MDQVQEEQVRLNSDRAAPPPLMSENFSALVLDEVHSRQVHNFGVA